jgi:hypothetical protein
MTLKLFEGQLFVETMHVPESIEHTYILYVFEKNTEHLHPVLILNGKKFKGNKSFFNLDLNINSTINVEVQLLDDTDKVVRTYTSKLEYNVYQILGNKPIRPNIEVYLYQLEEEIRSLKEELIKEKERFVAEQNRLNEIIKEIEERGEIV